MFLLKKKRKRNTSRSTTITNWEKDRHTKHMAQTSKALWSPFKQQSVSVEELSADSYPAEI